MCIVNDNNSSHILSNLFQALHIIQSQGLGVVYSFRQQEPKLRNTHGPFQRPVPSFKPMEEKSNAVHQRKLIQLSTYVVNTSLPPNRRCTASSGLRLVLRTFSTMAWSVPGNISLMWSTSNLTFFRGWNEYKLHKTLETVVMENKTFSSESNYKIWSLLHSSHSLISLLHSFP